MGLLTLFAKDDRARLVRLPSGSFTIDPDGNVMTSTLPRTFPSEYVGEISRCVLTAFRSAEKAKMVLTELIVHYGALKISARELRGGAIIFLNPQGFQNNNQAPKK